jgi:methionyl-tRNA formyltransferase
MRVALLAPIGNSLYSLSTAQLLSRQKDVEVCAIVVRSPWGLSRLRSEWRRDGTRLVRKVLNKWLLRDQPKTGKGEGELLALAHKVGLQEWTLQEWARKRNIPCISVADHNTLRAQSFITKASPDLMVFTGGGLIRKNILNVPRLGVLNCHSGWLPEYRGMDVIEWAVLQSKGKQPLVGLSLHYMDQGVDAGPILLQKKLALEKGDTFEGIRARLAPLMAQLMVDGVNRLRDGKIKPRKQLPDEGKQYFVMHPRLQAVAKKVLQK